MSFFRSPEDLAGWVRERGAEKAARILVNLPKVGEPHVADVVETTKRIAAANDANAAGVLYGILKAAGVAGDDIQKTEDGVDKVEAADEMLGRRLITAEAHSGMVKEAQIMRQPGQYEMPLRLCPKLPWSVGKKLISTYNCRHYCLDGVVLDDDPMRVYCGELLWRRHMADKFSSDFQDRKTGELVGGYINERFYRFPDAGTPANPDVPRDGGNPMMLKPGERSRQPRPHQWSVERRMQEAREKGSTEAVTLGKTASGWLGRMVEAQVQVEDVSTSTRARGYLTKTVGGVDVELEWEAKDSGDGVMMDVDFEWPEDMMMDIEKTPGQWNGDVCNPDTREMILSGLDRENLEKQWSEEVLTAIANADITAAAKNGIRIEAKKKGKPVNPWAVCHTTVDKDKNPEKYERCVMDVKEKHPVKESSDDETARRVIADADRDSMVRLSSEVVKATDGDGDVVTAFEMAVDLHNEGVGDKDSVLRMAEATGLTIESASRIQAMALRKMAAHVSDVYQAAQDEEAPAGTPDKPRKEVQEAAKDVGLVD